MLETSRKNWFKQNIENGSCLNSGVWVDSISGTCTLDYFRFWEIYFEMKLKIEIANRKMKLIVEINLKLKFEIESWK